MSPSLIGSHIDGPPFGGVLYAGGNGFSAGTPTNGHEEQHRSHLQAVPADELHDLVCVGFGPASLAIAVALHDSIESGGLPNAQGSSPKVLFLEKQPHFAWHAGMLLPGARMQISFIKDMATFRDPRSHFTFLNFLHQNDRLVDFTNLNTFLPSRVEYEEYLRWCADHFGDVVRYGQEAISVSPLPASQDGEQVSQFAVTSRNIKSGNVSTYRAKNVLLAIGGQPNIPKSLPASHPRIVHSSQYAHFVPKILSKPDAPYRVAVIGAGQSAAEIFNNVQTLYPNSRTYLVMRSEFLKPSDDSPFVNSIFNPSYIDTLYPRSSAQRKSALTDARTTNYGVVRLGLIEKLYERMYDQRRELGSDARNWPHRILGATDIVGLDSDDFEQENLRLRVRSVRESNDEYNGSQSSDSPSEDGDETLEVDLIIAATGYQRKMHLTMLEDLVHLLPEDADNASNGAATNHEVQVGNKNDKSKVDTRGVQVSRDYAVQFAQGKVAPGSGIWLQGCNEGTHGLSDTLLSVLANRSGEIVESIFGSKSKK